MSTVEERKAAAADKATRVSLDRTTSGILRGTINTPYRQLNAEQKLMLDKARLRQEWQSGKLTTDQVLERAQVSSRAWEIASNERTIREGQKAARALKSETVKQDTQRGLAAQQGIAVGTINDNKAQTSKNSQVTQNAKVSNFVESQKQSMSNYNKQNFAYEVTLTEGKKPKENLAYEVNLSEGKKPNYAYEVTLTENQKAQQIQQDNILVSYEKNNPLQNLGAGLYNSLRYYDAVQNKEVEEPKGIEWLNYFASKGLSPIFNIPLGLMGDKKLTPTLSETFFDTGLDLVTKGKTKTHDPIGDYIRKDPLGTLAQLPAEGALWITGGKVVGVGAKAFKTYSPIQYEAKKILTSEGKTQSIIKSITNQGKPIVSIQQGKLTKGYDPLKISYEKINVATREGFEGAVGSGIEKEIFYGPRALTSQVDRGIIPDIAKERASAWVKAVDQAKGVTSKGGTLGKEPIEGLTQKQSDKIFKGIEKGQKEGTIDLIHGSTATKAGIPETVQELAGSSLKLGDNDNTPKGKNLRATADKLIQGFAADFPLTPGQRLSIEGIGKGDNVNRALKLYNEIPDAGEKVYHGTPTKNIKDILSRGFTFDKSATSGLTNKNAKTIFANTNPKGSYGGMKGYSNLEITLVKNVNTAKVTEEIIDNPQVYKLFEKEGWAVGSDALRLQAKKEKMSLLRGLQQGTQSVGKEVEILDSSAIKSIKVISGKDKGMEWVNPKFKKIEKKEPKKILEVVLRQSDESSKYGISQGNKILNQPIPFKKSMTVKDYPIKTHSADYQLLTNVKQALAYQKGKDTLFDIYTSSGRTKDIVRAYWNLKGKAVFKGGKEGKDLDKQAEYIRSLYPKLEFTDYKAEKVLLFSSKIESKSSSKTPQGLTQLPLRTQSPKESNKAESIKQESIKSNLMSSNYQPIPASSLYTPISNSSRYVPRPISRPLSSISIRQQNITKKLNGYSINPPKNQRSTVIPPPKSPRSTINPPPKSLRSIINSPIQSNSIISPPPRPTKTPNAFGRIPQSRLLDNNINRLKDLKRPIAVIPFDIKNATKRETGKTERGHDFLGTTGISTIHGFRTKKVDITVGDKKTESLYHNTLFKERKNSNKSAKKSLGLLGNNKKAKSSLW